MNGQEEPAPHVPQMPREMRFVAVSISETVSVQSCLAGKCHVVDGDTIVIRGQHIRLAGIDAPEMDHPFGVQAKWALVNLTKGQMVTAHLKPELSHNRLVAQCFLPDGRDLAAEMVKMGLAIDWPKYSGGRYAHLEPEGVRKKLWRAAVRQKGMADQTPVTPVPTPMAPRPSRPASRNNYARRHGYARGTHTDRGLRRALRWIVRSRIAWLLIPALLAPLVGFSLGGKPPAPASVSASAEPQQPRAQEILVVTAESLNVRAQPSGGSEIVGRLQGGVMVVSLRAVGRWHAIMLQDGTTGWVHGDFLRPAQQ